MSSYEHVTFLVFVLFFIIHAVAALDTLSEPVYRIQQVEIG
jgi:hypothetical protein